MARAGRFSGCRRCGFGDLRARACRARALGGGECRIREAVDLAAARAAIAAFPGAELLDEPAQSKYPTPLAYSEKVKCGWGGCASTRLDNGLAFWVSGDNLWKGAALNSIQIAELMIREGLLKPKAAAGS